MANILFRHSLYSMTLNSFIGIQVLWGLTALAVGAIIFSIAGIIVCVCSEDDGPKTIMTFVYVIASAILLLIVLYINKYIAGGLVIVIANVVAHKYLEAKRKRIHG